MISFAGNVYNYFTGRYNQSTPSFESELQKLDVPETDVNTDEDKIEESANNVNEENCKLRKGVITKLNNNVGEINNELEFPISYVHHLFDPQVGAEVSYLSYKHSDNNPEKIVKIIEITPSWGKKTVEEIADTIERLKFEKPEFFDVDLRNILTEIKSKHKSIIGVDYNDTDFYFDLETVKSQFIPRVGDYVYIYCKVQQNYGFTDLTGEIVEVISITKTRAEFVNGTITFLSDSYGLVDNEYYFTNDVLPEDYKVQLYDKVCGEAIESRQLQFNWRCLKLVLIVDKRSNITLNQLHDQLQNDDNTHGIKINDKLSFVFDDLKQTKQETVFVTNTSEITYKILKVKASINHAKHISQIKLVTKPSDELIIKPGETVEYIVEATALFYGTSKEIFEISFENFKIRCYIDIEVQDLLHSAPTIGTGPIHIKTQYSNNIWNQTRDIVAGRSSAPRNPFIAFRIPSFEVPIVLRSTVLAQTLTDEIDNALDKIPCFRTGLQPHSYTDFFDYLLWLEEIQTFHNIRKYDREKSFFTRENEFLSLEMPNISECRPSIAIGDSVNVTKTYGQNAKWYKGSIHKVYKDRILLKFIETFHQQYNGEDYKIEFCFSRTSLRKQHYAVKEVMYHFGFEYLFPMKITTKAMPQFDVSLNQGILEKNNNQEQLNWYNPNLNLIQKMAILKILRGEARPMPYIIFGPPGTGKTMTLIEAILQICCKIPNSRILVGTPSNSAANLITERLINSKVLLQGDFVRLVSHNSIERESIPENILPYCITIDVAMENTSDDNMITTASGLIMNCKKNYVGKHLVTIGTCSSLGNLIQLKFNKNHFTHVIIDEAGQLVEPEAMIPISFLSKHHGQVILAGDPMQLGPIILSRHAVARGFGVSFLERMLSRTPYQKDRERFKFGYDPRLVTKLLYNYRSLPSILQVYNKLFYNSDLKPMIKNANFENIETQLLTRLDSILPNPENRAPNCNVFFHGVIGQNLQTTDSPSWYNPAEAKSIFKFVLQLYGKDINKNEIGVITPYQQQVKVVRKLFQEADLCTPTVGSVEEFQGQQRDIIIISTVRSSKSLMKEDFKNHLGFVQNAKRLNVAISRAKYLLIIFGNPLLLSCDSNWKYIIEYCIKNNTYTGCNIPENFLNIPQF